MSTAKPANANSTCVAGTAEAGAADSCAGCPNQSACKDGAAAGPDPALAEVAARLAQVKHKLLVLSGKGGVGKSTVACQMAWSLADRGYQVGILDIDICGPSVPRMLGVEAQEVRKSNYGWAPVFVDGRDNLSCMSIGFMLPNKDDAVIWRGPRKNGLIKNFLTDVDWGELDFLIIDAPPGTSDEHISIAQYLKNAAVDGVVMVTTPQEVSLLDVRKEVNFCRQTKLPVLGVVENMSGFVCPCCQTRTEVFPASEVATGATATTTSSDAMDTTTDEMTPPKLAGAAGMAADMQIPFIGALPLDPLLLRACERGESYNATCEGAPAHAAFNAMLDKLLKATPALEATVTAMAPELAAAKAEAAAEAQ